MRKTEERKHNFEKKKERKKRTQVGGYIVLDLNTLCDDAVTKSGRVANRAAVQIHGTEQSGEVTPPTYGQG